MITNAIIGFGPAGMLTLACFPQSWLHNTVVFEPASLGGALTTQYGNVVANISKSQILNAFRQIPDYAESDFPLLATYADEACPKLSDVIKQMRSLIAPRLSQITLRTKKVTAIKGKGYPVGANGWQLTLGSESIHVSRVFLCTGAEPKTLDLPVPHIPLQIALNPTMLEQTLYPTDRIVVFGTAHSGTLVLKNLKNLGCSNVTAIYKGKTPFRYARDGDTEGIKQESAMIADEIQARAWETLTPTLLNYDDFASTYRAIHSATSVIYATGFKTPEQHYMTDADATPQPLRFRPITKDFEATTNIWGFGIGYPGQYTAPNGNVYSDVGFGGFIDAIKSVLGPLTQ